jgi:hypothetical protein
VVRSHNEIILRDHSILRQDDYESLSESSIDTEKVQSLSATDILSMPDQYSY